jgi:hypothetical protein
MSDAIIIIKGCSPLKLHGGLKVKCHAIYHYSYNLTLPKSYSFER